MDCPEDRLLPGDHMLATASDGGLIVIWDNRIWKAARKTMTRKLSRLEQNEVKRVAFSPDGGLLAGLRHEHPE